MFTFAEEQFYGTDPEEAAAILNVPNEICNHDELKRKITRSDPSQMLPPMLKAHSDYTKFLDQIAAGFMTGGQPTDSSGRKLVGTEALLALHAEGGNIERQRQFEIDSSLVAIDLAFTALKELRLAYLMHVHLQCTLKYLDEYRRALVDLRNAIEPLPDLLRDASVSK